MMKSDNYIPKEIIDDAINFMNSLSDDVDIYKSILAYNMVKPCTEADKFAAYWNLAGYSRYPHALIVLYENMGDINNSHEVINARSPAQGIQQKMKGCYLVLKENNLIGE